MVYWWLGIWALILLVYLVAINRNKSKKKEVLRLRYTRAYLKACSTLAKSNITKSR